ncbi:MAG: hypothetical protein H0U70_12810 [Tatlockia sp.]|nr:hypothetical protein [Tatlockia sp.]
MKDNDKKDHPEVEDLKNICDISPNDKKTRDICEPLKKENKDRPKKDKN